MAVQVTTQRLAVGQRARISSAELNEFFTSLVDDIAGLATHSNAEEANRLDLSRRIKDELVSLRGEIELLKAGRDGRELAYAARGVLIDHPISMSNLAFITYPDGLAQARRASVAPLYNQVTIPVNDISQKFFTLDFRNGEVVTSSDLEVTISGNFDALDGNGLFDHEYSGTITAGDPTLAFNGSNTSAWVREVSFDLDSDVDMVECELTVQVPSQANIIANSITVHTHPWSGVDITGLFSSTTLSTAFVLVSSFEEKLGARYERFLFPQKQVAQIKIRLRQRNWREINGKKVFRYGLEELGLQLIDWDKTWDPNGSVTSNNMFVARIDAPDGYVFNGLEGLFTTPDFSLEDSDKRHIHIKVCSDMNGANVLWNSDVTGLPQDQATPISLGSSNDTIYVLTTMNWVETTGGTNGPFPVGTSPYLNFFILTYSLSKI